MGGELGVECEVVWGVGGEVWSVRWWGGGGG